MKCINLKYYVNFQLFTTFPSAALVKITAEDTGGGIQPTTINLKVARNNIQSK